MSLFYKNKPEENPYPELEHPSKPQPKRTLSPYPAKEQSTFKKKEDYNSRASVFLSKQKQPEKQPGWCDKCCACFSLQYYKDYFKVTNKDVTKRILCNLKFWSGGFFKPEDQEYDLYGPFWLYTTMIFIVGAVHNVLVYANSSKDTFQYNFAIIGVAMTIFYLLGLALSIGMGLIFGCLGLQSKTSQIVCLYGYSMATYIICVLLCTVNMTLMSWLFLLYGAGSKIAFILKNVFESLEVPTSKKFMITLIVVIEAAVQFLIIKFAFIKTETSGTVGAAFSHMSIAPSHEDIGMLHLRYFSPTL